MLSHLKKYLSENKLYQPELVSCPSVDLDPLLFCQQTNHRAVWFYIPMEMLINRTLTELIWGLVRLPAPPLSSQSGNLTNGGHNICFVTRHCYIVRCALLHCYIATLVHCYIVIHCYIATSFRHASKHCTMLWCYIVPYDCLSCTT